VLKKICLFIILAGAYAFIMINYPTDIMKAAGYNQVLDLYASAASRWCPVTLVYDPGLRRLPLEPEEMQVKAQIPSEHNDYLQAAQEALKQGGAIVECSGMDAWHTTAVGRDYLIKLRPNNYRVVVMDGGHHLPTLGLNPDIILVPAAAGYAVHAATIDGIKVEQITKIAREVDADSVIAVIPRWALVKNQKSLAILTRRIMAQTHYRDKQEVFQPLCQPGMSERKGVITAYVNHVYAADTDLFYKTARKLGLERARIIYLAFDYSKISQDEARDYAGKLQRLCRKTVVPVNEPVKTTTVLFRGKR
jgi:hypothetical protein